MKPECPYLIHPKWVEDYEGYYMCDLVDKPCLVEYGSPKDCEEYQDFLKEIENDR